MKENATKALLYDDGDDDDDDNSHNAQCEHTNVKV
jgi:hypothetical protein